MWKIRPAELANIKKQLAFKNRAGQKRAAGLSIANKKLLFQNGVKEKRIAELIIANKQLVFQNSEKEKHAAELIIANKELVFQNGEKEKRAAELIIADKELLFQNEEKEKRAAELVIANKELINKEKRYRALVESSADAVLILNSEAKAIYASPSVKRVLGYTDEEMMQLNIFSLSHSDDIGPMTVVLEQLLANPGVAMKGHTSRVRHKDGSWRWIEATVTNLLHDPAINGIVNNFRDVTEGKLAEDLLLAAKSNLNAIIENTDALIYSLDRDFRYITFNTALAELLKGLYGITITPGYHVFDFINQFDPGDAEEWKDVYSRALNGETIKFEKEFIVDNYHNISSISIHPIWKDKQVMGLSCFVLDITQQKQETATREHAEREVLKAYEDKNLILESFGDAFFAVDRDWTVTYWNSQAEKLLVKSKGEMLGKGLWEVFSDAVGSASFKNYHRAIETNKPIHFEDYYLPLDKWYEISAYPSDNGLSVYFKNITERKLFEMRLMESEKKYSELFHLSPVPNWVYDSKSLRFLDVNQAAIDHYGYSLKEFLRMTIKDIRPKVKQFPSEKTLMPKCGLKEVTPRQAITHQKKNGERIQVDIQSNDVWYRGRNACIVIASDITERLNYIKAIEAQIEKLKEISWMQSHIIRAPLARIMGLVPLISDDSETLDCKREMLGYLSSSANELDQVIGEITAKTEVFDLEKTRTRK